MNPLYGIKLSNDRAAAAGKVLVWDANQMRLSLHGEPIGPAVFFSRKEAENWAKRNNATVSSYNRYLSCAFLAQ